MDDIDHLGGRRIRSVGEMAENQFTLAGACRRRAVKSDLSLGDLDTLMPRFMINAQPISAAVKEFAGSSQRLIYGPEQPAVQLLKRRISALGERSDPRTRRLRKFETYTRRTTVAYVLSKRRKVRTSGLISSCRVHRLTNMKLMRRRPAVVWLMAWLLTKFITCLLSKRQLRYRSGELQLDDEGHFCEDLVTCRSKANPACSAVTG